MAEMIIMLSSEQDLGQETNYNFSLNFIYFIFIVKQVLKIYLNHSRVRFLEATSTGVIRENMIVTLVWVTNPRCQGCGADTLSLRPMLTLMIKILASLNNCFYFNTVCFIRLCINVQDWPGSILVAKADHFWFQMGKG